MNLINIAFNEDENIDKITVSMTLKEAAWIARIAGKCNDNTKEGDIYHCLVGTVFNRFYEDGVAEAPYTNLPIILNSEKEQK